MPYNKTIRLISLTPSNTEIVHALGLVNQLVGIDDYSDYPEYLLKNIPRLGPDLHIRINEIVAIKPDLILASLSVPGMEKIIEQLKGTGLEFMVLNPKSLADIWKDMRMISEITGTEKLAEQKINEYKIRIEQVQTSLTNISYKPKLYWEWWPNPCISPGGRNWLTEISSLAGAYNIFADIDKDSVIDAAQAVCQRDPDYFLAVWTGVPTAKVPRKKILQRPGWQDIRAFKQDYVFILEEGLYCRPSPRLIDGLEALAKLIHPCTPDIN